MAVADVKVILHPFKELGWPRASRPPPISHQYLPSNGLDLIHALKAKYGREDIQVETNVMASTR